MSQKSELGPHAHEKQMPSWLVKLLQEQDGVYKTGTRLDSHGNLKKVRTCPNMAGGIIPVLEQLLDQDDYVKFAYLCDPAVKHVSKLRREGKGAFCVEIFANRERGLLWVPQHSDDVFLYHRC